MKVFKFGGASVNSAAAVRNMAAIVKAHLGQPLVVVVSAMGKTTNALERLVPVDQPAEWDSLWHGYFDTVADYHRGIVEELFADADGQKRLLARLNELLGSLYATVADMRRTWLESRDTALYGIAYDSIVSYGEIISTTIISHYLDSIGMANTWLDVRTVITTDERHREGCVDWPATLRKAQDRVGPLLRNEGSLVVTQGFIAASAAGATTTLGREGSDYSAAILSYCLDAEAMTIWKDVDGFLDADPKYFSNTRKIEQLPYNEAIELAYYGASVIHPKTVKPIQNKGIRLYIKSFLTPDADGSVIGPYDVISPQTPLYIVKSNQVLISIMPKDFSFIAEENLQIIFGYMAQLGIKANMMQNSALSFSICIDDNETLLRQMRELVRGDFKLRYNRGLDLVTIRYYDQEVIDRVVAGRRTLLQQRSRNTAQILVESR